MSSITEVLNNLDEEKKNIEKSINDQWKILHKNNVGMTDSLVDQDDYPRNDIDISEVRNARVRIKCLQIDHTTIMKKLEKYLEDFHNQIRCGEMTQCSEMKNLQLTKLEPFLIVNQVTDGSPAFLGVSNNWLTSFIILLHILCKIF